ncbi:3-methyl-2-oxobutanoate hydroxymethyltransferase (EC 2.1.2.11) [uncultured Gammaproteobacteria bacterium]|jgi:3-methyl-2-oxobutanoate hydroxymethyltransferase|uniref:3-methyl-2-oxobutanoate hydroxymethyltransferase n=3 Tax=sulfur-oxidizing symbionts TaxID=32036 RepID=A0A1H6JP22_9GAMM|nr:MULTISPECIES: 3-methyl-2-oxobutanoate hydroxymethyltransferase [sulfur-oxidizing symbionts]CAC9425795.1 3-methyl-2-oxobutanoate hydroxymethyltransferase (EC 2.1.2.11) [uncultured Gammaproteobacteria bacterium]CAB5497597.1 3-methyl-2-oxobutanoate hydroxymethyltransferase (EC [Bathymodiolus azoricus thioautotrophic gill symbiont]CAB5507038.1 3-methyl-2-oxobutanoate hydroxymethyltransferase (EC [Bathymodiolus thermophilus thioautotrophic gill symbiont]CAC9483676.1 3-methyl-2-oxobutanoate hydrox
MKIDALKIFKNQGEKITCLTAYDASFASVFDKCGVDIILVGDSLGNVIKGDENTLGVSMNDMLYHTQVVAKVTNQALLISDMPYQSYTSAKQTLENAKYLMNAGAQMVKFEGGHEHESSFQILQDNNIPVCGHLGLQPQSVVEMGGYKVQGKGEGDAQRILKDAKALEAWGVKTIVLECIPAKLGKKISQSLNIPTIGIGAGVNCDGQVLVGYDMLGITQNPPKFVKNFLTSGSIVSATNDFIQAVKNQTFPTDEHSFKSV